MSKANESNRPQSISTFGAVAATVEIPVLYAHKKVQLHSVRMSDIEAITADDTNYLTIGLLKNGAAVGSTFTTKITGGEGFTARECKELLTAAIAGLGPLVLAKDDFLTLAITVAASGAVTYGSVLCDIEVIGNG